MRMRRTGLAFLVVLAATAVTVGNAAAAPKPEPDVAVAAIRDCIDVPNRDVGRGDSGNYVREVQCLLNWAVSPSTYHLIAEDGSFGSDTEGKVVKFQRCANARGANLSVDGRVGSHTAPYLEQWAASASYVC